MDTFNHDAVKQPALQAGGVPVSPTPALKRPGAPSWLYPYAPGRREKLEKCQMIVGAGSLPKTLDAVLDTYIALYKLRHCVIDAIEPQRIRGTLITNELYEKWRQI